MEKKYYCPVCGKCHNTLTSFKNCIEKHEKDEAMLKAEKEKRAKEAEAKAKAERAKELEVKIQELSKEIQSIIEQYNKEKTGKTYTIRVSIVDRVEDYWDKLFRNWFYS